MSVATIETNDFLTTREAAEALGLSIDSVRRYLNNALSDDPALRPKLYGRSFGSAWMIHRDEIARYKRERQPVGRRKRPAS